jgi:cAMP-specific phosphodiesterase 4
MSFYPLCCAPPTPTSDVCLWSTDKQQEIDLPTLKVEDADTSSQHTPKKREKKNAPMSEISGVRKLRHTNSFTGVVPRYGVDIPHEKELSNVSPYT